MTLTSGSVVMELPEWMPWRVDLLEAVVGLQQGEVKLT